MKDRKLLGGLKGKPKNSRMKNSKFWKARSLPPDRLSSGIRWNAGALVVLGVSGIAINVIIGRYFGAAALGVFNQVLSIYLVLSQVATGGLFFSVLKHVSDYADDAESAGAIVSSSVAIAAVMAGAVALALYAVADIIGLALDSRGVAQGIVYIAPGLWFSAMNRTMLAALNGARLMRAFAVMQSIRYIVALALVTAAALMSVDYALLPFAFTGAELCLFVILSVYVIRCFGIAPPSRWNGWGMRHGSFLTAAFFTSVLNDMNTKVDVLMLGVFASDKVVGVYSFASMLNEGFMQLGAVVRQNFNPLLARMTTSGDEEGVRELFAKSLKVFFPFMAASGVLAALVYPYIAEALAGTEFYESWPVFAALAAGVVICSPYLPFTLMLSQAGHPRENAIFFAMLVGVNVALNLALIPLFGALGAALATGTANVMGVLFLRNYIGKVTGFHLTLPRLRSAADVEEEKAR